jgi:hypothetical protein
MYSYVQNLKILNSVTELQEGLEVLFPDKETLAMLKFIAAFQWTFYVENLC